MSFEEMVVALVGAIGAFALVGYLSAKIFDLIKTWINRKNGGVPEEDFNRLARAFMEHKKNTRQRLQNLEAIVTEEDSSNRDVKEDAPQQIEGPKETIEIEDKQSSSSDSSTSENNLRNMLRE